MREFKAGLILIGQIFSWVFLIFADLLGPAFLAEITGVVYAYYLYLIHAFIIIMAAGEGVA